MDKALWEAKRSYITMRPHFGTAAGVNVSVPHLPLEQLLRSVGDARPSKEVLAAACVLQGCASSYGNNPSVPLDKLPLVMQDIALIIQIGSVSSIWQHPWRFLCLRVRDYHFPCLQAIYIQA